MVCRKCGNKIENGMRFCGLCGSPAPELPKNEKVKAAHEGQLEIGGFAKLSTANKDKPTIMIAGMTLNAIWMFKGMALLLLVSFFLPFYSIGNNFSIIAFGERVHLLTANGFRITVGWDYASGTFAGLFMFLVPIAIFALFQFRKELERITAVVKGMLYMAAAVLSVLGLVLMFVARDRLSDPHYAFISVRPSVGFFISFVLYLVVAAVSVCFVVAERKK